MIRLSDNIRINRGIQKWTQQDLANKLGISRTVITRWETEESIPDLHHLIRLCEFFDTNLDTLVGHQWHKDTHLINQNISEDIDAKTIELLHYLHHNDKIKDALYNLSIAPHNRRKHLEKIILILLNDIVEKLNVISYQQKPS